MISSQASNLLDFSSALLEKRLLSPGEALEQVRPSHAEVSQQLRNQLQTTLDITELMQIFFAVSQQLVGYKGLSYQHSGQSVQLELGQQNSAFRIDYHMEYMGEFLGKLSLHHDSELVEQDLGSLESLTPALVFPLRNALKYHAVLFASLHDPLTGARNRSGMDELLERDIQTARRQANPLAVLMLDIDHFKNINDTYGHAAGDQVLIAVAGLLKDKLRVVDAIFRYGGEEFLIVLPNTDMPYVLHVAERLRKAVEDMVIVHEGRQIKLSASLGAALMQDDEHRDVLVQRADNALYLAKNSGRNRVCLAD